MYHKNQPNEGKYIIHEWYGIYENTIQGLRMSSWNITKHVLCCNKNTLAPFQGDVRATIQQKKQKKHLFLGVNETVKK